MTDILNKVLATAPVIDNERVTRVYNEIGEMPDIYLHPDPLGAGPAQMNTKRSQIRNQMTRCTALELQALKDMGWFQREITRLEAQYDLQYHHLVASDPDVKSGRSAEDRKARADEKLKEEKLLLQGHKLNYVTLESMLKVIRTKKQDLKNHQLQLKEQMKTCEHELGLGRTWGVSRQDIGGDVLLQELDLVVQSTPGASQATPEPQPEVVEAVDVVQPPAPEYQEVVDGTADLDALLDGVVDQTPEALEGRGDDASADEFLEALQPAKAESVVVSSATNPDEDDLDDLLAALS